MTEGKSGGCAAPPRLARCPWIVGCGGRRFRWRRGRRGKRGRDRWCARWRGGGHRWRCCRARGGGNGCLFLCHRLLRRWRPLQSDLNRIGGELRSTCAVRLGSHGHGLCLVAAQRKGHRELAAGLDRELAWRAAALTQRGFRFRPWRYRFNGQRLRLRSGFEEIQARHCCRTRAQHQARRREDNNSPHDPTPRRQRPPLPGNPTIGTRWPLEGPSVA